MLPRLWNLTDVFSDDISIKLQTVIPVQILNDIHHYKYDEGKDKPMSVYLSINQQYKTENIMEVFTRILKVLGTKDKIIDEANEYMEIYGFEVEEMDIQVNSRNSYPGKFSS